MDVDVYYYINCLQMTYVHKISATEKAEPKYWDHDFLL